MLKKLSVYTLALLSLLLTISCKKDYESVEDLDSKKLTDYISGNSLNLMVEGEDRTGYYYQILSPGTGELLKNTDSVLYDIRIKGLDNENIYYDLPAYANRGTHVGYTDQIAHYYIIYTEPKQWRASVKSIPAIRNTILKLKRGGSARILLPSYLGYGKNGTGNIPSNQNLDITLTLYQDTSQMQRDDRLIRDFITSKGLKDMKKDPSGVWYYASSEGSELPLVTEQSTIQTSYTGRYTDGTAFETVKDATFDLSPDSRGIRTWINGWRKVLPGHVKKRWKNPNDHSVTPCYETNRS